MEETSAQKKVYSFFQLFIYLFLFLDVYIHCFSIRYNKNPFAAPLNAKLYQIPVIANVLLSHLTLFIIILLISLTAAARKNINFHIYKHFIYPFLVGALFYLMSIFILPVMHGNPQFFCYAISYLSGPVLLQVALSNLTKRLKDKLKKDVWNEEEESFEQNKSFNSSPDIFNVPIRFFYKKRIHKGWMNINPFRGIMVLGVPGSGKTESIIIPFIKQFLAKGYSMMVYDFKYPALAKITYYHYLLNKQNNGSLKNHEFHCVNLDEIEYSRRINPLDAKYIKTLADAGETADAVVTALKKSDKASGSDQFFTQSAINFLSAAIFFLAKHQKGKYSTLPHLLAFIALPYDRIFTHLFSMIEIHSLLSPFKTAYDNKSFDQLEGQIGTLKIQISRLATKESFWVFSASDFDLKISNPPSIMVLANSPKGQNINSAFFAAVLVRTIGLINSPGNNPSAIVVDETPTLYLHKIDNLIATARSNKVAVVLGLQELPQFHLQYGKETANTITSIMGSVISGAVRAKETLDWLEKLFGKIKQNNTGLSIDRNKTSISINERMDTVIPASKIANQNTGEVVGIVSRDNQDTYGKYEANTFRCKVTLDLKAIDEEKKHYPDLPKLYDFGDDEQKANFLLTNLKNIYAEIEGI